MRKSLAEAATARPKFCSIQKNCRSFPVLKLLRVWLRLASLFDLLVNEISYHARECIAFESGGIESTQIFYGTANGAIRVCALKCNVMWLYSSSGLFFCFEREQHR